MIPPKYSLYLIVLIASTSISTIFGQEPGQLWSDNTVPYTIDAALDTEANRATIQSAMDEISSATCIKFIAKTDETRWLAIQSSTEGCNVVVGSIPDGAPFNLSPNCLCKGIIMHGLYHAVGITKPGDPPIYGSSFPCIRLVYNIDNPEMCSKTALNPPEIDMIKNVYNC